MKYLFRPAFILACLLAVLLVAACGGSDDDANGPPDGEPTPANGAGPTPDPFADAPPALRASAERALLTLDDFPEDWRSRAQEEREQGIELNLPEECRGFIEQDIPPGAIMRAESEVFVGPLDEEVESFSYVYESVQAAEASVAEFRDFVDRCAEPVQAAFIEFLEDRLGEELGEGSYDLREFVFDDLPLQDAADDTVGLRLRATLDLESLIIDLIIDFVGVRVDRMTAGATFTAVLFSPPEGEAQRLAGIMADRLRAAVADLE